MARTSVSDIKDIIELDTLTDSQITAFMNDANQIVDNRLDGHTTDANLTLIEKWLAAHLCAMREQRVSEETVGPITMRYEGDDYGQGLRSTRYGQMAVSLDPTGRLHAKPRHTETVNTIDSDRDGYSESF